MYTTLVELNFVVSLWALYCTGFLSSVYARVGASRWVTVVKGGRWEMIGVTDILSWP